MEENTKIGNVDRGHPAIPPIEQKPLDGWGTELLGAMMARSFFEPAPEVVAPRLLGKILVRRIDDEDGTMYLAGRIVEVEAYLGPHNETPDPAAHSYRGPTRRNRVMFGPAGHAYVYAIYGLHFCMNVTCEKEGQAGCVLVRALEPLTGLETMARKRGLEPGAASRQLTAGPGRLCQALEITRAAHNGLDLHDAGSPLQLRDDGFPVSEVLVTTRIGIRHAVDWPLRFALPGHDCLSGPRSLTGSRSLLR